QQWQSEKIVFLVLRNYEGLPHRIGNDIDVLVSPKQLQQAEAILIRVAEEIGYQLHNRAEFSPVSLFFFHPESCEQVQFDLFYKLVWRGLHFISTSEVLERRVAKSAFFVPH